MSRIMLEVAVEWLESTQRLAYAKEQIRPNHKI
jgi:hypothetical protein